MVGRSLQSNHPISTRARTLDGHQHFDKNCADCSNASRKKVIMKTFLRWIGVFVLPIPALLLLLLLSQMLSSIFAFVDPWDGTGNRFGLTIAAVAITIYIAYEMAPCAKRFVSLFWAVLFAGLNLFGLIFMWNDFSHSDVVQTIALILGSCLGAYGTIKK